MCFPCINLPQTTQYLVLNYGVMTSVVRVGNFQGSNSVTVKILKFGTPQTIAIIVLKLVKFDVTLH